MNEKFQVHLNIEWCSIEFRVGKYHLFYVLPIKLINMLLWMKFKLKIVSIMKRSSTECYVVEIVSSLRLGTLPRHLHTISLLYSYPYLNVCVCHKPLIVLLMSLTSCRNTCFCQFKDDWWFDITIIDIHLPFDL